MKKITSIMVMFGLLASGLIAEHLDLSGNWQLKLDRTDRGEPEQWYAAEYAGSDVRLPGSIQEQGYGDVPGPETQWVGDIRHNQWNKPQYAPYRTEDNFKMPFWLQPERYYKGLAWFQRNVVVTASWKGQRVTLTLERPHWQTTVWVGSQQVGQSNSLATAHVYDLTDFVSSGENRLTICVDNRVVVPIGVNSHSITDHTQSNWNGIVGEIKLMAEPLVAIDDLQIYTDQHTKTVSVELALQQADSTEQAELNLEVLYKGNSVATKTVSVDLGVAAGSVTQQLSIASDLKLWDEFSPELYELHVSLKTSAGVSERRETFGFREISVEGNQLMLNGSGIFMRGTLECAIFPLTGYPPTDVPAWERIIKICKAHGLNHIRFHSWCPPKAAFVAADRLGMYLQVECSSWCNYGKGKGLGQGHSVDEWLYEEADAILKAYGNHPSFVLFAYGNEPDGPGRGAKYLKEWVPHYQAKDARRLVSGGAGWPSIEANDFFVPPHPRIQRWGERLRSRINSKPPETMTDYSGYIADFPNQPIIAHEIGQWCAYPNFEEIEKYTGVLKAKNFEIFQELLQQKGLSSQAHDFLMASGKLQTLCYKEDIESALRTQHFGGFQLLDLHDFPGQGTALVGVLDPFWDSKGYVTAEEYKAFAGPVVPLARMPKRIFTESDRFVAGIELSQFGAADLNDTTVSWKLQAENGEAVRHGQFDSQTLAKGHLHTIGQIDVDLKGVPIPAKYTLVVDVPQAKARNSWDVWVYADEIKGASAEDILVTNKLDRSTMEQLNAGKDVFLTLKPKQVATEVKLGFSSIFWNTAWTNDQAPHTLGILCDPQHPALKQFPTDYHSNWQWSLPIQNAAAMQLDNFPDGLEPIVQIVPDWFNPKKLGLVFEAKVGQGRLIVSSIDLMDTANGRPVERQLKHSLLEYMASDAFAPEHVVTAEQLSSLLVDKPDLDPVKESEKDERPNIIWIMAEDISTELSCYEHPAVQTPVLDGLAEEGIRYEQAFCTAPSCTPSRNAMLTGVYQTRTDTQDQRRRGIKLPKDIKPITELLGEAGYYNALGCGYSRKTDHNFKPRSLFDGKDWSQREEGQPFFAQITLYITHRQPKTGWGPVRAQSKNPVDPAAVVLPPYFPDTPECRMDWALYLDSIEKMDSQVGEILDRLEREEIAENTVVIFSGDNGRCHLRGKCWLYDPGLQVPLIIRWPGQVQPAQVNDDLISMIDISATILDIAGVELPASLDGHPILGSKAQKRDHIFAARDLIDEVMDHIRCVRTERFKYIRNYTPENGYGESQYVQDNRPMLAVMRELNAQGKLTDTQKLVLAETKPAEELYDVLADPHEINNLAANADYQTELVKLRALLDEWIVDTKDQGLN